MPDKLYSAVKDGDAAEFFEELELSGRCSERSRSAALGAASRSSKGASMVR